MHLRVLIVTCDPLVQHRLAASLQSRGVELRFAHGAPQMVGYCQNEHFAAIVLDLGVTGVADATQPLRFCRLRPVVIGLADPAHPAAAVDGAVVPVILRRSFGWELLADIVTQAARAWHESAA